MHTLSPTATTKSNNADTKALQKVDLAQSSMLRSALSGLDTTLDDELSRYHHWQENGQSFSYLNAYQPLQLSMSESVRNAIASDRPTPARASAVATHPVAPELPPNVMMGTNGNRLPQQMAASAGASHTIAQPQAMPTMPLMSDQAEDDTQISDRFYEVDDEETVEVNTNNAPNHPGNNLIDEKLLQEINEGYENNNHTAPYTPGDQPAPVPQEEEDAQFSLTSPLGIAAMFLLLLASAVVGYLLVRPSDFAKMFSNQQSNRELQQQQDQDITLRSNHDIDSLLADEDIFPDLPYTTLPGQGTLPGQNLDKFTSISPDITESLNDLPAVSALPPELESSLDSLAGLPPVTDLPDYSSYNSTPNYDSYVEPAVRIRPQPSYSRPAPVAKRAPQAPPKLSSPPIQNIEAATSSPNFIPPTSSPDRNNKPIAIQPQNANQPVKLAPGNSVVSATIDNKSEGRYSQQLQNNPNRVSTPAQSRTVNKPANNIPVQYAPLLSAETSSPAPAAPAPTQAIAPPVRSSSTPVSNPGTVHKVVVDQNYAPQAQQIDQNAYVRPSDGKLQVGAYQDESAAQQRVEELRRQGIPAQVD
jgi:hypothetical protein